MPTRWAGRRATVQGMRAGKSRAKRIECVFFVDFDRKIIALFRILQGMRRFFLSRCLFISIFPMAELEYVCSPSAQGEGGELQWREDGATKRDWREKRGAVRRKRGTKQKYSRRPIHFFPIVFVPLLSEHVLRPSRIDAMRAYRLRAHSRVNRFPFFTFTPSPECHIVL